MVEAYIFGIFPRSEPLIEATRKNPEKAKEMLPKETKKIIELQKDAGLSYISDPLLGWDDMLRPYSLSFKGIKVGGLNRFFETNTFYRVPIVKGKVRGDGKTTLNSLYLELLKETKKPLSVSLPEPLTFALMCKDESYGKFESLASDIAVALSREAKSLKDHFDLLILKAPYLSFIKERDLFSLSADLVKKVRKAFGKEVILHTYFKDVSDRLDLLLESPADGLGIDTFNTPMTSLKEFSFKSITVSMIDGYNTKMETSRSIKERVMWAERNLRFKKLRVSNNLDLEYVPYSFAVRKVKTLSKAIGGKR